MLIISKLFVRPSCFLLPTLLLGALLIINGERRQDDREPLEKWDIPRLVDHLNKSGLRLRLLPAMKTAVMPAKAFLTMSDRGWDDLNSLPKDRNQIDRWASTLYCERCSRQEDSSGLAAQWYDCSLAIGPFLFFGDIELLGRVRAALLVAP